MGFLDIGSFNQNLLAKQVWHLMQNSDSLVARILMSRYHPRRDILRGRLGNNPSFI